jgi:hypothetical protein
MASAFSIVRGWPWAIGRQRLVGVEIELDLRHLHVERQIDRH